MKAMRKLLSMGSAKVRNALCYVFTLITLMIHKAASCVQEDVAEKAALSGQST